eukprot:COSAG04_NODE_1420_length_6837_cov_13.629564_6_plen_385_part_00
MTFQWSLAALETLMSEDQMNQHCTVLRAFSIVGLWRLRRVCRAFHRWGTAALAALPRPVVVGGEVVVRRGGEEVVETTASVEVLDLSTLRWASGVVPPLPQPRDDHAVCAVCGIGVDGRVVVAGSGEEDLYQQQTSAMQWVFGAPGWVPLPNLAGGRSGASAVALPDGRAMVIGGFGATPAGPRPLASVEILAADGSGWSAIAPMRLARNVPVAVGLPCGKVLVAGGLAPGLTHDTAELWDPATGAWSDLPPMAGARSGASCCVLPSGRVAVIGGCENNEQLRSDGEAFDPEARTWQPLPPMTHARNGPAAVVVAGGMLVVGGDRGEDMHNVLLVPDELFDEESGQWFNLPHAMAQPRMQANSVVSLPAAALARPAAGQAAAVP